MYYTHLIKARDYITILTYIIQRNTKNNLKEKSHTGKY